MEPEVADPEGASEASPERPPGVGGPQQSESEKTVVIIGDPHRGRQISRRLASVGEVYRLGARAITTTAPEDITVSDVSGGDTPERTVGEVFSRGAIAVVATAEDARNLLVTQRLRTAFGADWVYVVLNDPRNRVAFELPGVSTLCLAELLADAFTVAESELQDRSTDGVVPEP